MKFYPSTTQQKSYFREQQFKFINLLDNLLSLQTDFNITIPVKSNFKTYMPGNKNFITDILTYIKDLPDDLRKYLDCIESLFINMPGSTYTKAVICLTHSDIYKAENKKTTYALNEIPDELLFLGKYFLQKVEGKTLKQLIDFYFVQSDNTTYLVCKATKQNNLNLFVKALLTFIKGISTDKAENKIADKHFINCSIFNIYYSDKGLNKAAQPDAFIKLNIKELLNYTQEDFLEASKVNKLQILNSKKQEIVLPADYIIGSYRYQPSQISCQVEKLNLLDKVYLAGYQLCGSATDLYTLDFYKNGQIESLLGYDFTLAFEESSWEYNSDILY